ncbi:hypothetical protein [Streptomyces lincolnensis]|nr:hypothetical protein [Streptomyces lincolnensis]
MAAIAPSSQPSAREARSPYPESAQYADSSARSARLGNRLAVTRFAAH